MSADLLSYLVTSSPSEETAQIGAARDLIAARVLAAEADRGNPDALAFVQGAQESLAQAQIRRARANRLRAGAARASLAGHHTLARMGAEAASEEETGANMLEANVAAAIRGSHALDGFGYYSESEKRELQRKAYEESLSASQREDVMNKLLSQLYQSSDTLGGDENGDNAAVTAFLDTAASVYAGDLDSVFGADVAERMGAVTGAAIARTQAQIAALRAQLARAAGRPAGKMLRQQIAELQRKLSFLQSGSRSIGRAEDARERMDAAEEAMLEQLTDYGAEGRLSVVAEKLKTMSTRRVKAIARDPLRKKSVRAAARAELERRAEDEGEGIESDSSASNDMVATPPKAFDEEGYLASYKGITPARRRFIQHFRNRAARMGADSPEMLAYALRAEDTFGGFFSALGDFFRNIFSVGRRDAKRISTSSKAAREARQSKREDLLIKEQRANLAQIRVNRLEARRAEVGDPVAIAELDNQISRARADLRAAREAVRAAGKEAFDKSYRAQTESAPSKSPASAFPVTGSPILRLTRPYMKDVSQGGQIASLQTALRDLQVAPDLRVDGVYGPKTEAAVRAFQKKNALAQDGKVGPATASVLASAVSKLKS